MLVVLTACTSTDSGLEAEVAALSEEVDSLQNQLDSMSTASSEPAIADTTSTTSSTIPATTVPETTTTMAPLPAFPPEAAQLSHGGDAWVVVLAASEASNDPALVTADLAATEAGYNTGPTDCDLGAADLLGLSSDGHYYTLSVYLENEEDAIAAREAFAARGVGGVVGVVQTFCLD